ncbi:MAG: VOC family protein [Novosphingobium sp.]|jgi:catechol 2,3-dioxygenase-like lactoylglutathione lyase family enzyme|nr:VOC family protein [Novosphingobium sp.]
MAKAKLRHVAINCEDLEGEAKFFKDAFDLEEVGRAGDVTKSGAIYMSDGVMNIALIRIEDPNFPNYNPQGLNHIGFVVEDLDAVIDSAEAAGAKSMVDRDNKDAGVTWEMKMKSPSGKFDFDLSDHGWPGIKL